MPPPGDPPARPRARLSRDRVVRAGVEIADRDGIAALTMRRVAESLGVEAMALYYHVASKGALLEAMVDDVVGEIEVPPAGVGAGVGAGAAWKPRLRASAISAHDVLLRHPWAVRLLVSSGGGPARLRYMDGVLGALREAGFSVDLTHHAYHVLDSHIVGFTLWAASYPPAAELTTLATSLLRDLPAADFPHLTEHVQHHLTGAADDDGSEFEFGLDLVLDGLERLLGNHP